MALLSAGPLGLLPGDYIHAWGQAEVSNKLSNDQHSMFGYGMLVGDHSGQTEGGWQPMHPLTYNLLRKMHHGPAVFIMGGFLPPEHAGNKYVNFVCWSNRGLKVESGYGKIQGYVERT